MGTGQILRGRRMTWHRHCLLCNRVNGELKIGIIILKNFYTDFSIFRKLLKLSRIYLTKAGHITQYFKIFRKNFSSYNVWSLILFLSYISATAGKLSSYTLPFEVPMLMFAWVASSGAVATEHWTEHLGGDGPRVAAYLRVSTGKQAKEGMSLEVQKELIENMKNQSKPSVIYWFVDPGKSGRDFDSRKLKDILELREKKLIDELWFTLVDRIGRECRKAIIYFLHFTEDGGVFRTPERTYDSRDLIGLLSYIIDSYSAEMEDRRRAERANASKARNFRERKWNKPIPFGYESEGKWIRKIAYLEPVIKEAHTIIISMRKLESVKDRLNYKFSKLLKTPLTRNKVKQILTDPVYIGKPQHMGVIVNDESLKIINDETFKKTQEILNQIKERHKPKKDMNPIKKFVNEYSISALEFLDRIQLHHRNCGGRLNNDGTRWYNGIWQQLFSCTKCNAKFWVPINSDIKKVCQENYSNKKENVKASIAPFNYCTPDIKPLSLTKKEVKKRQISEKASNMTLNHF